jgi:hypothetical protein
MPGQVSLRASSQLVLFLMAACHVGADGGEAEIPGNGVYERRTREPESRRLELVSTARAADSIGSRVLQRHRGLISAFAGAGSVGDYVTAAVRLYGVRALNFTVVPDPLVTRVPSLTPMRVQILTSLISGE